MRTFQAEETASAKALRKPCVTLKEQQKDHRAREDGIGRGGKGGDPAELRGAEWWVFWNQDQNPSFITGNGITLGRGCGSANVTGEGTERSYVPGVSRLESFSVPHVTCLSFSMAISQLPLKLIYHVNRFWLTESEASDGFPLPSICLSPRQE